MNEWEEPTRNPCELERFIDHTDLGGPVTRNIYSRIRVVEPMVHVVPPYVLPYARRLVVELGYALLQHTVLRRLHRTCLRLRRRNNEFQLPRNWGARAREEAMPGWARAVALDGWELAREVGIWVCGCGGSHEIWNPTLSLSLCDSDNSRFIICCGCERKVGQNSGTRQTLLIAQSRKGFKYLQ